MRGSVCEEEEAGVSRTLASRTAAQASYACAHHSREIGLGSLAHGDERLENTAPRTLGVQPIDNRGGRVQEAEHVVAAVSIEDEIGSQFMRAVGKQGIDAADE